MRKTFLLLSIVSLSVMMNGCGNKNVNIETTETLSTEIASESRLETVSESKLETISESRPETVSENRPETVEAKASVINTTATKDAVLTEVSTNTAFSDDIRSGYFKLDGDIYKLPMTCQDFMANGWTLVNSDYADFKLAPGDDQGISLKKGRTKIHVTIANIGDTKTSLPNLHIVALSIDEDAIKNSDLKIELPKGIILSEVELYDIERELGEFDYVGTSTPSGAWDNVFEYKVDEKSKVRIYTDFASGKKIESLYITSLTELTNKQNELLLAGPVDVESIVPTPEVSAYQKPSELGTNLASGIIEIEGELYQFPIPASALERNGWKLSVTFPSEIEPGEYSGVHFFKGEKGFDHIVYNIGKERTSLHNCFLDSLTLNGMFSAKLPGGVQVGSSREDLINALEGADYEFYQDYFPGEDVYLVNAGNTERFVRIMVSTDTNKVSSVMISMSSERKVKPTGPSDEL